MKLTDEYLQKKKLGIYLFFLVLFALQFSTVYPFYKKSFYAPFMAGWFWEYITLFILLIVVFSFIFWRTGKSLFKKLDWLQAIIICFWVSNLVLQLKYRIDSLIDFHEEINRDISLWKFLLDSRAIMVFAWLSFLTLSLMGFFISNRIGYIFSMLLPLCYISTLWNFSSIFGMYLLDSWQMFLLNVIIYPILLHQKVMLSYWKIRDKKSLLINLSISILIVFFYYFFRYIF